MKTTYVFRNGNKTQHGVPAQAVAEHLETLRKPDGKLKTVSVVDDARSASSPLHPFFTWDDTKAARAHRLWEAQQLISSVKLVYRTSETDPTEHTVSAFANVRDEDQHYVTTVSLMNDATRRALVLRQELEALEAWRRRNAEFEEFFELFPAIDRAVKRVAKVIRRTAAEARK